MLTVLVPYYNGEKHLKGLVDTIPQSIPIVVIDDVSDKPLETFPRCKVARLQERGYFTGAVNKGLDLIPKGDVLILNQDTYFTGDKWLKLFEQDTYDLIGEGVLRHPAWHRGYIHGTFMYITRKCIDTIGKMDAKWYPHWGSTCEYQLRAARKGLKALAIPQGQVPDFVHKRKGSLGDATKKAFKEGKRGQLQRTPPMISVVINAYNHGRFLEDAINSLVGGQTSLGYAEGQTFQSFEIIIVDDGSTDDTPKIAQKLADPTKGIHYIRQDNHGSAVAMNTGIARAKGKYIAAMDSDDMMKSHRLERMLLLIEDNPHSCIYDDVAYFGNGKLGIQGKKGWTYTLNLPKQYNYDTILQQNKIHKGILFPRKAWEEVGGYPPEMNQGREDWAFNVALGRSGYCGIHTGEADYLYRREGHNRTLSNTTPFHKERFKKKIMQLYPDVYRGEKPEMCCGGRSQPKNNVVKSTSKTRAESIAGAESGMVILEYIGNNAGDMVWAGPITGQNYVMGGATKRQYVDKKDAGSRPTNKDVGSGMLAMRENKRYVFEIYTPPEPELIEIKEDAFA